MTPFYRNIHSHFKLNANGYTRYELKEVAYSLIKEGEPFEREIGDFLFDWLNDSPTLTVKTSGSTGSPKDIILQKRHMVNSAVATGDFFSLHPGDSALLCLPATYIAGKMMLVRALVLGLELNYVPPSANPLEGVRKSYDFCAMVPLQLENSLDRLEQIKTLIAGGAPLTHKILKQLPSLNLATAIYETYGMTETITHIALKKLHTGGEVIDKSGQRKVEPRHKRTKQNKIEVQDPTPHFKALPNVTVSSDDRNCLDRSCAGCCQDSCDNQRYR